MRAFELAFAQAMTTQSNSFKNRKGNWRKYTYLA